MHLQSESHSDLLCPENEEHVMPMLLRPELDEMIVGDQAYNEVLPAFTQPSDAEFAAVLMKIAIAGVRRLAD